MKKITLILIFITAGISVFCQTSLSKGTPVFAEWSSNSWYHGVIGDECGSGYTILYDDGDQKCCSREEIVLDVVPESENLQPGMKVLALWPGNDRYYPATLGRRRGDQYQIAFDDGDTGLCTAGQVRILGLPADSAPVQASAAAVRKQTAPPRQAPAARPAARSAPVPEPLLSQSFKIWQNGSSWAEIIESGRIWIDGSQIGEIEADGDVYVDGYSEGEIESDGDVYVDGSHRGEIEENGVIWWDGSSVGSIESDGKIWIDGSSWGEVQPAPVNYGEIRAVAGIVIFFSETFGLEY